MVQILDLKPPQTKFVCKCGRVIVRPASATTTCICGQEHPPKTEPAAEGGV